MKKIVHLTGMSISYKGKHHIRTMCGIEVIAKCEFYNVGVSTVLEQVNCKVCLKHRFVRKIKGREE
jgi:hypothetical protein